MTHSIDESLAKIIVEKDFQKLLQREIQGLLRIHNFVREQHGAPSMKRFYSCLMEEARELKNFLDDFDARNNRQYALLTELVLSLVSFSAVGYLVRHVFMRYPRYALRDERAQFIEYHKRAEELLDFSHQTLLDIFAAARKEAEETLGIRPPAEKVDEASFTDLLPRMHLPHNVGDRETEGPSNGVPIVANLFLQLAEEFEVLDVPNKLEPGAIREFLDEHCSEVDIRKWEARVHEIQRKYDTLLKGTLVESREEAVRTLRGHISMVLHHFEMLRYQGHFLDHLRKGIKYEPAAEKMASMVNWDEMLRHVYRFTVQMGFRYIDQGKQIAKTMLAKYTNIEEVELRVPDETMLHARPASLIVGIVNHHGTPVSLRIGGATCDASSIMQVMMTLGGHVKEKSIRFRGDERPLRDLELLFAHKLGEEGVESLPGNLDYLKPQTRGR